MAGKDDILKGSAIDDALAELPDWRFRQGSLVTVYKCPTSSAALELIAAVGRIAEQQKHHPDLDWRYNRVLIRYTSHDAGSGVTRRDVRAAMSAGEAAAHIGAVAEPEAMP
ncbi:4a-hydroxytetrahydrobiopterin dehydratase [Arthrobacter bambusae]|uniref:4a-hydroxytetrahydrobiopterin dehydratase n=1 Tax=Arthrobacter bambusae TaxID=1338426 RepID=UPI002787CF1E|nr:4a-hydroxytetrahydrobiopterin dehydratase [Arthrobacter bambusae]MDQ0030285.1 4a-hydroxytetrahydrobiopterin dehydratase [Arthrobacter bambusae]MDQ0097967.1 4a-hydroxytetrahydrobiopterin dehydratase [Arthrobacter bambusae]